MMNNFLRQPLVHFMALGTVLFVAFHYLNDSSPIDNKTIVVDRESLLTYMQYREKSFNRSDFEQQLAVMSLEEQYTMAKIIRDEEVLYREAMALGLEQNDVVIRNRLVQKIKFIAKGIAEENTDVPEQAVQDYYDSHQQRYFTPARITFSHIFFADKGRDRGANKELVLQLAASKLTELQRNKVIPAQATQHGDRFLYFSHYVERNQEYVNNHFGLSMAQYLFNGQQPINQWLGPVESKHGVHLVNISKVISKYTPSLAQIYDRVVADANREAAKLKSDKAIEQYVNNYRIDYRFEAEFNALNEGAGIK